VKRSVPKYVTLRDRLFLFSAVAPSGCWIWQGKKLPSGYGVTWDPERKESIYVHRASFLLFKGYLPTETDHLCRNRACWNPEHLEDVSHRENLLRGDTFAARNHDKTICSRGHQYDAVNKRGKRRCRKCEALLARKYRALRRIQRVQSA
jgi:hypothetical protein